MLTPYIVVIFLIILGVPAGLMVWLIVAGITSKRRERDSGRRGFPVGITASPPPPPPPEGRDGEHDPQRSSKR